MGFGASPEHTVDSDFGSTSSGNDMAVHTYSTCILVELLAQASKLSSLFLHFLDDNQEIIVTKVDPQDIEAMSALENLPQQGMLGDKSDLDNVECEPLLDKAMKHEECANCQGKALHELGSSVQRLHSEVVAMNHMLDLLVTNQEKAQEETARHREETARYRASKLKLLMEANEIAAKRLSMDSPLETNSHRQHLTLQREGKPSNLRKSTLRTRGGASASHARKGGKL